MNLSESPQSQSFIQPPHIDVYSENNYEKAEPVILTKPTEDMNFTKNIILVYQYPPDNKLFVPTYISSGYQTHYAIYKLEQDEMKLLFTRLHIVYEGIVYYYIMRDLTNYLYDLGLNKYDVDTIKNKKYKI